MKNRKWLCTTALLALPALAGCGGSSSSSSSAPIPTALSVSTTLSNGLTAALIQDRYTVPVGGTVTYTETLTNSTAQPISFCPVNGVGSSNVPASVSVGNQSGQAVYPLGPYTPIVSIGPSITLAPGQAISETQVVDTNRDDGLTIAEGYSTAGQYKASAIFTIVAGTSESGPLTGATAGPLTVTAY